MDIPEGEGYDARKAYPDYLPDRVFMLLFVLSVNLVFIHFL